jgi:hypothetical protein
VPFLAGALLALALICAAAPADEVIPGERPDVQGLVSGSGALTLKALNPDRAFARAQDKKEKPDGKLAKALAKAYKHFLKREAAFAAGKKKERYSEHVQLWKTLVGVADLLPKVTPGKKYTRVKLNAQKVGFDAFRFKVPGEGAWAMKWEFVLPGDTSGQMTWYIIGNRKRIIKDGSFKTKNGAFTTVNRTFNYQEKGANLPEKNTRRVQPLEGELDAGEEYIIWFLFKNKEPIDAHIRIGLTRPKKK